MFSPRPASLCRQQTFDLRDRMMGEILGHLGDDLAFVCLCKLAPEIAENFRRRHDHKLVERTGQGNLIDPVPIRDTPAPRSARTARGASRRSSSASSKAPIARPSTEMNTLRAERQ